jgi:hypothetical protein
MPVDEKRIELIRRIQDLREGAKVLVYFTGDRPGRETQVAEDVIPLIHQHLQAFGRVNSIDLYLYTRGGILFVPWRLVTLTREFARYFSVLIPYRCHSAGTLIALGANEIVMTKMGELSPVDPQFAKVDGGSKQPQQRSIEEVISYISFAKEKVGITEQDQLGSVLNNLLSKDVTALDVGSIHRGYNLIRLFVRKLLSTHMRTTKEEVKIEEISKILTEKLFSHDYKINRKEARDIGLNVRFRDGKESELESRIWELYLEYEKLMELSNPWNPERELGNEQSRDIVQIRAAIESENIGHQFFSELNLSRSPLPAQLNIQNIPPNIPRELVEQIIQQVLKQVPGQAAFRVTVKNEGWKKI